uniref:non-specific serine/threonine protein kinase n=2 Tax=Oryza TaxID=4527 RepID=A0A0E0Q1Z5_ORYRU
MKLLTEQSSLDFVAQLSPEHNGSLNMSWALGTDCCSWEGINCRGENTVRDISLPSKGLAGSISPSLSNLAKLLHLNLSHNSLSGGLPMDSLLFSSIAVLDVSFNHLDGPLQELQSSNPSLSLPLQVMNISSNFFHRTISISSMEMMKNLVALNASNNSFTGQIPASICISTPSFAVLDLLSFGATNSDAEFPQNGKIPNSIGQLNKKNSIGQLRRLEELHLDNNNMVGELPSALGNRTNLRFITLRGNRFTGDLGKVHSTMLDLKIPNFSMNNFTVTIHESIYSSSNLIALWLAFNRFHGHISQRIGDLNYPKEPISRGKSFRRMKQFMVLRTFRYSPWMVAHRLDKSLFGCQRSQSLQEIFHLASTLMNMPMLLSEKKPATLDLKLLDLPTSGRVVVVVSGVLVLLLAISICGRAAACAEAERAALLSFLAEASPPAGDAIVADWRGSPDCCRWDGVGCGGAGDGDGAVTRLSLPGRGFNGTISPSIGNLTGLTHLNLSGNSLAGQFPEVLFSLPNVTVVDVSYNCLSGELPSVATGAAARGGLSLEVLDVSSNLLAGQFPSAIWEHTPRLVSLNASNNSFHGSIPSLCVSCPALAVLDLTVNVLSGVISPGFGNCSQLRVLSAGRNNLTGELPGELFDVKPLQHLQLPANQIEGRLDQDSLAKLTNLVTLDLSYNLFTGELPESISKMPKLEELRLANNNLTGTLPSALSNWTSLRFIDLRSNSFVGNLTDVDFSGLPNLTVFDVASNNFTGTMPPSIYSCTAMKALRVSRNVMDGQLSGVIPPSLMEMRLLTSEQAMAEFNPGHLILMFSLNPDNEAANRQGRGYYQLSGVAATLNFGENGITGTISPEVGKLKTLQVFDVSYNNLSGGIPPELTGLDRLQVLDLRWNRLTGTIPSALNKLNFLAVFNVAHNDLEGPIPTGGQFDAFPPKNFMGNPKLCGRAISVPCGNMIGATRDDHPDKHVGKRVLIAIVLGVCIGLVALVVFLGCVVITVRKVMSNGAVRDGGKGVEVSLFDSMSEFYGDCSKDTILFMSEAAGEAAKRLTFVDILKATNNFSQERIIGSGGYGLVFLAELEDGARLAVKKLNGDMCLVEREFQAEVEALSATRHENLVPLLGFCIRGRLRLLLYPYMANGSLHDWLHERRAGGAGAAPQLLDWRARLNVARGASRGVLYIHEQCKPQIVHRDIKSSNILLDEAGEARVADFGLARLILPDRTHVTTELVGTPGYIPPEYGQAWVATRRGDVYSFGVVLLELLTGRRPVEAASPPHGQQRELVRWVLQMRLQGRQAEVLDTRLSGGNEAQMLYVLDLACLCVDSTPFSRPAIQEVVSWLDNVDTIGRS